MQLSDKRSALLSTFKGKTRLDIRCVCCLHGVVYGITPPYTKSMP